MPPAVIADTRFSGYLKSYLVLQDDIDISGMTILENQTQLQNGIRLMFDHVEEHYALEVHYELSPVLRRSSTVGIPLSTLPEQREAYRITDPDGTLASQPDWALFGNLDRANIKWQRDWGDLTVGRQPITFGAARIINPTDVFLPFNQQTLNTEYRIGVDAIRLQRPLGTLSELDIGVILGPDADADVSAAYVQVLVHAAGNDLSMTMAQFSNHELLGVGTQSAIGQLGFWFEVAAVSGDDSYMRLSTGIDYAFNEDWFFMVEAHFNSAGAESVNDYGQVRGSAPFRRGEVYLSGRRYLIPVLSWQLSPLAAVSVQSIVNLSDRSVFTSLTTTRNVTQNAHMDVGIQWFTGDTTTFTPPFNLQAGSEFGDSPTVLFGSVRWYF
ncbi:MAG: hypothetical protein AAF525_21355 [Pseudomonadota bacterium]